MKKVSFCLQKNKLTRAPHYDRRLSSAFYRGLIKKCIQAQLAIYKLINQRSGGLLLPLSFEKEADVIKVRNPIIPWDEDSSPIELWEQLKKQPKKLEQLVRSIHSCSHNCRQELYWAPFSIVIHRSKKKPCVIYSFYFVIQEKKRHKADFFSQHIKILSIA